MNKSEKAMCLGDFLRNVILFPHSLFKSGYGNEEGLPKANGVEV